MNGKLKGIIFLGIPKGTSKDAVLSAITTLFENIPSTSDLDEDTIAATYVTSEELGLSLGTHPMQVLCRNLIKKFGIPDLGKPYLWVSSFVQAYYNPSDIEVNNMIIKSIINADARARIIIEQNGLGFLHTFLKETSL